MRQIHGRNIFVLSREELVPLAEFFRSFYRHSSDVPDSTPIWMLQPIIPKSTGSDFTLRRVHRVTEQNRFQSEDRFFTAADPGSFIVPGSDAERWIETEIAAMRLVDSA